MNTVRPEFIQHYRTIQDPDDCAYPNSDELLSIGSAFGKKFGFKRLGIHHEVLKPGRRTSWPHAEKTEEEFAYVIEGRPHVWIDGNLWELEPGDAVGFVPGTGIAHTFLNNTLHDVRLLVVGDTTRDDNELFYPLNPQRNQEIGSRLWQDVPRRPLGPHNGMAVAPEKISFTKRIDLTQGYSLTEIRDSDRAAYLEHFKEREIYDSTLNIPFPYTDRDADFWLQLIRDHYQQQGCVVHFAIRNPKNMLIGGIGFHGLEIGKSHRAELGYWLAKPYWGRGITTEAARAVCHLAACDWNLIRITAHIFATNTASEKVLLKAGFRLEGVFAKHYAKDGQLRDAKLFALVK